MPDEQTNGSYQAQETVTSTEVTVTGPESRSDCPKSGGPVRFIRSG